MTQEEKKEIRFKMRKIYNDRLKDIKKLLNMYKKDPDAYDSDLGNLNEYGLSLDKNSEKGEPTYYAWVLSTGGPGDEFRFYVNEDKDTYKIEFWYYDWGVGEKITLRRDSNAYRLLEDVWYSFLKDGLPEF
jgi:hypothetical protein